MVLGYDNLLISADVPGVASLELEERLGKGAIALYVNGGGGDVNPLISGVRAKLTGEYTVDTMFPGVHYYGTADSQPRSRIGDRGGDTFEEAEELGHAVAEAAWKSGELGQRDCARICRPPCGRLWRVSFTAARPLLARSELRMAPSRRSFGHDVLVTCHPELGTARVPLIRV